MAETPHTPIEAAGRVVPLRRGDAACEAAARGEAVPAPEAPAYWRRVQRLAELRSSLR